MIMRRTIGWLALRVFPVPVKFEYRERSGFENVVRSIVQSAEGLGRTIDGRLRRCD